MFTISDATVEDISTIQAIAEKTWWPTYSSILSEQQIRFMLDAIYRDEALRKVMADESQRFILLHDDRGPQGFASYGPLKDDPKAYKLFKLYVLPENHGKGYGKILINEVVSRMQGEGVYDLQLNVNRYNNARAFYERMGFKLIAEEDVPIGPYLMNDYVMRLHTR